jgi:hypothetical protein
MKIRKGIALTTVGYLVLAIIALVVLWIFLWNITPEISNIVDQIITGIICKICSALSPLDIFSQFCRTKCSGLPF